MDDAEFSINKGAITKKLYPAVPLQVNDKKPLPSIGVSGESSVIPLVLGADSNAIVAIPAKTFGRSPWKFGLVANGGISGAGKGIPKLPLFSTRSDQQFATPGGTPAPPAYLYNRNMQPSEIQNGPAFGIGLAARKQLGKRFAFQTGIHYQYLSTRMKVGSKTSSFSAGNSVGSFQDTYTSASINDYNNKFHFISVPALLEYQLLKRKPLNVFAGVSFRHLVSTNALYFDNIYKVYYNNQNSFTQYQVFAEWGLNYAIAFKGFSIAAGPHIQYSLNELEKQNENRHLVSLGLRAIMLLQKK
jgi:hypothetical protein